MHGVTAWTHNVEELANVNVQVHINKLALFLYWRLCVSILFRNLALKDALVSMGNLASILTITRDGA